MVKLFNIVDKVPVITWALENHIMSSEHEKGQIMAYKDAGFSNQAITKTSGQSVHVVNNYMKLGSQYATKTLMGRPKALTPRQDKCICRMVSSGKASLGQLSWNPDIGVHKSTLSRLVQRCRHLQYMRKKCQPHMMKAHKATQLAWGKEHLNWGDKRRTALFSNEKNSTSVVLVVGATTGMTCIRRNKYSQNGHKVVDP